LPEVTLVIEWGCAVETIPKLAAGSAKTIRRFQDFMGVGYL